MSFQIHKNGSAFEGVTYSSFEQAAGALDKAAQGGEVTAVDGHDQIVRRYTYAALRKPRNVP